MLPALIHTIISLYYDLLIVKAMFTDKTECPAGTFRSDNYTRLSLVICLVGIFLLGIVGTVYEPIAPLAFGM